jgi:hypothetical protein
MTPAAAVTVTRQTVSRLRSTLARSAARAHARAVVASASRACGAHVHARRSTRRFCSSPCRQAAYRAGRRPMLAPIAHQRRIRKREAALDPRPQMVSLEGSKVERVSFAEARAIIVRCEWLRSMPSGTRACYGLRTPSGELAGVAVFAANPGQKAAMCAAASIAKRRSASRAAPASIGRRRTQPASDLARRQACSSRSRLEDFCAYVEAMAGEIGTVYQAAGWLYLGVGVGRRGRSSHWRFFSRDEGRWHAERAIGKRRLKPADLRADPGWVAERTFD